MMRCVSYTRTVPWRKGTEMIGIQAQNKMVADYISGRPGWTLVKKYSDRKNSPDADSGFERLVADGTKREYDCIVVPSLYYCGTSFPVVRQRVYETLYAAGIQLAVVSEDFDSTGKTEQETADYFEGKRREMHGDIFHNWKQSRGKNFVLTNSVPYGYLRPNGCDHLIKDDSVSAFVEEVFRKKMQGVENKEIALWLNGQDADTPLAHRNRLQGKPLPDKNSWQADQVWRLVTNPVYMGALKNKGGNIIAAGGHEPYVTEEEFYFLRENDRESRPKLNNRENYRKPSPLSSVITCADCGAPVQRRSSFKTGESWFVCTKNCRHGTKAHPVRVSTDEVYQRTFQWMREEKGLAQKADGYFRGRDFRAARLTRRGQLSRDMQTILAEMELEQFRRVPLYEQYRSGRISGAEYEKQRGIFREACAELNRKLTAVMEDAKNLEVGFSIKNPWIMLYSQADIPEQLDKYSVHKLIGRMELSLPKKPGEEMVLTIYPKLAEWKDMISDALMQKEE